jgi:hypothetical protein
MHTTDKHVPQQGAAGRPRVRVVVSGIIGRSMGELWIHGRQVKQKLEYLILYLARKTGPTRSQRDVGHAEA